ncbi:MAG: site-2 protease family protein [Chitinivibrionales bacterium]|nr:site-2 protease family protein [Chitinivibrionales bacterium]
MSTEHLLLRIPAILLALTVHEYAHGWIASLRGDTTARDMGRLTFNPIAHLDFFGTIMLLFGPFGWAKPVPVNYQNLKDSKTDPIFISAAGPVSNIILACVAGYLYRLFFMNQSLFGLSAGDVGIFFSFLIQINLGISFFNLLPVPPLDGSKILLGLLPSSKVPTYHRYMRKVPMIFLLLIIIEWYFNIPTISLILYPLYNPYRSFWLYIIFGGKAI